jgi:formiminotetrahydrofolate cyclodeaminase
MKNETCKGLVAMKLFVVGAGLAGLAAAYFFLHPKGKKQLDDAKSWVIKMKGDVAEKLEKARDITETAYHEIVDAVAKKNEEELKASPEEIQALAQDLKKHWQALSHNVETKKIDSLKEV